MALKTTMSNHIEEKQKIITKTLKIWAKVLKKNEKHPKPELHPWKTNMDYKNII